MRRRFKRRGRKMFTRRRRFRKKRIGTFGGVLKFSTRFKGGKRTTQVPIPQVYFTKHPCFDSDNIDVAAGSTFIKSYQPSSVFSFDGAGADAGFAASMLSFWNNWVVLGYSYVIEIMNSDNTDAVTVGVLPLSNTTTDPTTFDDFRYRPGAQTRMLAVRTSSKGNTIFKGYVGTSAIYGIDAAKDDAWWGSGTTDPFQNSTFLIGAKSINDASTTVLNFRVKLNLYTKWFNRTSIGNPEASLSLGGLAVNRVTAIEKMQKHIHMLEGGDPKNSNDEESKEIMDIEGLEEDSKIEIVCEACGL